MSYVLATIDVPGEERMYYCGPVLAIPGPAARQVTRLIDSATSVNTTGEAEAMRAELGDGYQVVSVDDESPPESGNP